MRLRQVWNETAGDRTPAASSPDVRRFERANRLCGDSVTITVPNDAVSHVSKVSAVEARGCSLCTASAALLRAVVRGRDYGQLRQILGAVLRTVDHGDRFAVPLGDEELGLDIDSLGVLSEHPARRRCARLAWEVLAEVLEHHEAE